MPGTTLFTGRGDITLAWDDADDPQILAMIEAQMKAGVSFFLVEPRLGGMASPNRTPLISPQDAFKQRVVVMSITGQDQLLVPALESGAAVPVKTPTKPAKTRKRATSAKEVASGESVGVKAKRGG